MRTGYAINRYQMFGKHSLTALALAAGLGAGTMLAQTTTQTFNLGPEGSGTTIPATSVLSPAWIPAGTLPAGSILRSVSINARLDTEGGANTYANDLFVCIDPGAPPSGDEILQVGGYNELGSPDTYVTWANGNNGTLGTTCVDTKSAGTHFPDTIDLNGAGVFIGSRGFIDATWSGTVTVEYDEFVPAAILTFGPGAVVGPLVDNAAEIAWTVPFGTDVTALAPTFTLSSGSADRDNGGPTTYDFTSPVVYTVTDGETVNTYTVTVTEANSLLWNVAGGGDWDTSTANWLPLPSGDPTIFANGNEVTFDNPAGGVITIAADMSPGKTTVSAESGTYQFIGGPIATGSLVKNGGGTLHLLCAASIPETGAATPLSHTFDGGTIINAGTVILGGLVNGLSHPVTDPVGSGSVTLNGGTINLQRVALSNPLTVNGGTLFCDNGWGATWSGPVALNGNPTINAAFPLTLSGDISGSGGFTKTGNNTLTLSGGNDFTGPVSVTAGTLRCNNPEALGSGALSISGGGKVELNHSGTTNIAALILGGIPQMGGTHGSTASDATFKNDTYFSGTGTVTVAPSSAKDILSFSFGALGAATIEGTSITLEVPAGTDITNLAPTYTVSPGASGVPVSGTSLNFTTPQTYTITAQDLSTQDYTVTVTEAVLPDIFTWANAVTGNWSTSTNWINELETGSAPLASGRPSYTLNFNAPGTYTATNNLSVTGFQLNQLNLAANVTIDGNPLLFVADDETLPVINQNSGQGVTISNNLGFGDDMTFGGSGSGQVSLSGVISGDGGLTKNGTGTLRIFNTGNSFAGGTIINSGTLWGDIDAKVGTGPITLNGGVLYMWRFKPTNALIVNGGSITSENGFNQNQLNGPVTLNATLPVDVRYHLTFSNTITGVGGLSLSRTAPGNGLMILSNTCTSTYTGPTTVNSGTTLRIDRPEALSGDSDISINGTGKINLNYSDTKTIASLTLGGMAQTTPGTYGSTSSGADFQDDNFFLGTGTVTIGGTGTDYDTWLAGFTFPEGADTSPTGDANGDGMSNFEKYAFGLDPTSGASINPIVAPLDPATGNFQYTRRATPAATGLTYTVLTSTDLEEWNTGGATETGVTTDGDIETVTVNVTTPPVGGRLFVRVEAASAP